MNEKTSQHLGRLRASIQQRMTSKGLTMKRLSEDAGLGQAFVSQFLGRKDGSMNIGNLFAIAQALDIPAATLLGEEGHDDSAVRTDIESIYDAARQTLATLRDLGFVSLGEDGIDAAASVITELSRPGADRSDHIVNARIAGNSLTRLGRLNGMKGSKKG